MNLKQLSTSSALFMAAAVLRSYNYYWEIIQSSLVKGISVICLSVFCKVVFLNYKYHHIYQGSSELLSSILAPPIASICNESNWSKINRRAMLNFILFTAPNFHGSNRWSFESECKYFSFFWKSETKAGSTGRLIFRQAPPSLDFIGGGCASRAGRVSHQDVHIASPQHHSAPR